MKRWIIVLLACGAVSPGIAQVVPPAVQSVTLKNGLRVLLAPDSMAAAVDVAVWYGAGPRVERPGASGITHLMERLMFRDSPSLATGDPLRLLRAEGGSFNTFTTPDASCFFETLPAEALEFALKIEADRMAGLTLTAENVARERRLVREGRRQGAAASPISLGLQRLYATAFRDHPYGWPVLGLERDSDRLTPAACQAYHLERYAPNNAVLTLVGRFDPVQALRLVHRTFDPLPRRATPAAAPPPPPLQVAERRATERTDTPLPLMLVGWRAPGAGDPSSVALDLLSRVMTGGPNARLQRALTAAPAQCIAVEGGFDARRDASLLFAAAVLRPGADSAAVERVLLVECEKLAGAPVDAAELDRLKRQAEIELMMDWEAPRGRARWLGEAEAVVGDWRAAERRLERLRELTPEDLQRAAANVLREHQRTVIWLLPGPPRDLAPGPRPDATGTGVAR